MSLLKRKSPYGSSSASPAPGSRQGGSAPAHGVKLEDEVDVKRRRGPGGTPSGPRHGFNDPRTVVLELREYLKDRVTLPWQDAYFHIQDKSPGVDASLVLEMLKKQEKVKFNETNRVYSYEPDIVLRSASDLRTHIRTHSRPTNGLSYKSIRELMPGPECATFLEELEREGQVLILRSLTGKLKDAPLPELGRENAWGEKLNAGGPERWRTVFWDELKERGRAASRVDDEFIFAWADVRIAETDDVAKLLADQDLKTSSIAPEAPKVSASKQVKKKKNGRRTMKITNSHMKALGIDFSQDYEAA